MSKPTLKELERLKAPARSAYLTLPNRVIHIKPSHNLKCNI